MADENIVSLSARRPPVIYTITIAHHHDGVVEADIGGILDDDHSRASVAQTLARIAADFLTTRHLIETMLTKINRLMDAAPGSPEAAELSALVDACRILEAWETPAFSAVKTEPTDALAPFLPKVST